MENEEEFAVEEKPNGIILVTGLVHSADWDKKEATIILNRNSAGKLASVLMEIVNI